MFCAPFLLEVEIVLILFDSKAYVIIASNIEIWILEVCISALLADRYWFWNYSEQIV